MLPFSDHAKFEMKRRGLSETQIQEVYEYPQQKIKLANDREIWQNKLQMDGEDYIVRIVMELKPQLMIVTVYRSSKIKKYWRVDL